MIEQFKSMSCTDMCHSVLVVKTDMREILRIGPAGEGIGIRPWLCHCRKYSARVQQSGDAGQFLARMKQVLQDLSGEDEIEVYRRKFGEKQGVVIMALQAMASQDDAESGDRSAPVIQSAHPLIQMRQGGLYRLVKKEQISGLIRTVPVRHVALFFLLRTRQVFLSMKMRRHSEQSL